MDHHRRLLALQHLDELRAGEGGVEVEDVRAELGGGDRGVDEAAVVAAHDGDRAALLDAALGQGVRECVGALVQLAEGERPELVDDADPVGRAEGERGEAARPARSPTTASVPTIRASATGEYGRMIPDPASTFRPVPTAAARVINEGFTAG